MGQRRTWDRCQVDYPEAVQRIVGVDTARGLAILGMFVAHLGMERSTELLSPTGWFFITDGRPSALFALLAGVGLAFMTRRARDSGDPAEWQRQRTRILKRSLVLYLFGWVLTFVGTPIAVILSAYAVMFALMLPFLRARTPTVLVWAAGIVLVAQLPVLVVRHQIGEASLWRVVPGIGELLTGYYPAISWIAYLLVGLAVGRATLRSLRTQVVLLAAGAAVAAVGYGAGALLQELVRPAPGSLAELLVSTQPHADSAVEMIGNTGVAVAAIGLCLLLTRATVGAVLLTPVSASGAMSLTVYSLHIVYIAILGSESVFYPESNWPLIALILGTFVFATVWQLLWGQGPFERAMHAMIKTAPPTAQPTWAAPPPPGSPAPGHPPTAQPTWAAPPPPAGWSPPPHGTSAGPPPPPPADRRWPNPCSQTGRR